MFRIVTMCYGAETPFLGVRNRLIFPSNLSCSLSFMLCSCFKISRWVPPVHCPLTSGFASAPGGWRGVLRISADRNRK